MNFSDKLKDLRKSKNMSQEQQHQCDDDKAAVEGVVEGDGFHGGRVQHFGEIIGADLGKGFDHAADLNDGAADERCPCQLADPGGDTALKGAAVLHGDEDAAQDADHVPAYRQHDNGQQQREQNVSLQRGELRHGGVDKVQRQIAQLGIGRIGDDLFLENQRQHNKDAAHRGAGAHKALHDLQNLVDDFG